ncbi:hypothetical protein CRUP_019237 [Coryphaenoides rupestris]|nr:hypothetical protein CRUP_019237 [Coryphaenoides rupestris]
MLQQMLAEDKADMVREAVVKSLGIIMAYIDDPDKYSRQGEHGLDEHKLHMYLSALQSLIPPLFAVDVATIVGSRETVKPQFQEILRLSEENVDATTGNDILTKATVPIYATGLLVKGVNETLVAQRVVPALITLSSDPEMRSLTDARGRGGVPLRQGPRYRLAPHGAGAPQQVARAALEADHRARRELGAHPPAVARLRHRAALAIAGPWHGCGRQTAEPDDNNRTAAQRYRVTETEREEPGVTETEREEPRSDRDGEGGAQE